MDLYVKRNLQSWVEHTDAEIHHYEENQKSDIPGVIPRELWALDGMVEFIRSIQNFWPAHGKFGDMGQTYDYNFNAFKWCRKVYVQAALEHQVEGGLLVWLDADVELLKPLTEETCYDLLDDEPFAYFGRKNFHPEAGLVVYNMDHPQACSFVDRLKWLYESGMIFRNPHGWHDCWAMWMVLQAIPGKNLSPEWDVKEHGLEVMDGHELSLIMRHDKGQKKYQ